MAGANSVGTLSVTVAGNAAPLEKEFDRTKKLIGGFSSSVGKMGSPLDKLAGGGASFGKLVSSSALGNLLAGNVTGGLGSLQEMVTSTIDLAAEFQSANTAFGTLVGDMEKGKATVKGLQALAVETPFASKDLIDSGKMLLGMGVRAEQLVPVLSRLGDVAMGDAEKLKAIALQFGQVMSKGQMSKEEFNIFAEAGADVEKFADAFGAVGPDKMQQLFRGFEQGKVGADVMVAGFNAMTSAGGRFHQMNAKAGKDFKGQLNSFLEGIDNLKIAVGTAFIDGFKPGTLLEELGGSFGDLDKLKAPLQSFFERARYLFDMARGAASAYAQVMLSDVAPAFKVLIDGAPNWDAFKQGAVDATKAAILGLGQLLDAIRAFRHDMADMLDQMSGGFKEFGGAMRNMASVTPGKIGRGMEATGKAMEVMGGAYGVMSRLARPGLPRDFDSGKAMMGKFEPFLKALDKPKPEGQLPADVARIEAPFKAAATKMSEAAQKFYDDAMKKGTALEIFRDQGRAAAEAARFKPADGDQIFMSLAGKFLDLEKGLTNSLKVELPAAMKAGSQEAESVITHAMLDTGKQTAQERVEQALRRLSDQHERELTELGKIKDELKRMAFETMGMNGF